MQETAEITVILSCAIHLFASHSVIMDLFSTEAAHTKTENLISLPQDGRLRSGDHILRIGDTDLYGMGSEQVAQVLRQCGNRVKLVVTRGPVDENPSVSAVMPVVLPTVNEQQVKGSGLLQSKNITGKHYDNKAVHQLID